MQIDFSQGKISLVLVPSDMRCGYEKLASLAHAYLGIDLATGQDWVVFISKSKHIAKIIHHDEHGSLLIVRKLSTGTFQQLMTKVEGPAKKSLTREELERYLDGEKVEVCRSSLCYG